MNQHKIVVVPPTECMYSSAAESGLKAIFCLENTAQQMYRGEETLSMTSMIKSGFEGVAMCSAAAGCGGGAHMAGCFARRNRGRNRRRPHDRPTS